MYLNNKKYTLTKKGWIILSILISLILSILLYFIFNRNDKNVFIPYTIEKTSNEKLSEALRNNEITIDEYVLYSAYLLYDRDKLDDKYKSNSEYNRAPNLYNLVQNYNDELSEETKEYINDKIQMKDVILGPEKNKTSYNTSSVVPVSNEVANNDIIHRLDKHILSPNGKVVVWYTTNDTIDKITDEQAKTIANNIETYIQKYSNEYDIEFKWEKSYFNGYNEKSYKELLNQVDSVNVEQLFNAMPVYVSAATLSENVLAYYLPVTPGEIFGDNPEKDNTNGVNGIPVGPYINIVSNMISDIESLNGTIAHELFHHYQNYMCGEGSYLYCEDNENGDPDFIQETTANWAAAKIIDDSHAMSSDIVSYNFKCNDTIDEIFPYHTLAFLMNYETEVEDGKQKIINGLLKKYHNGDTLKYLYEAADNKMPVVMNSLSKNNLINDYEYESFKGLYQANFRYTNPQKLIENVELNIKNMAMNYLYTGNNKKKYKISNLSNNDTSYINVFSLSNEKDFEGLDGKLKSYEDIKVVYSKKFEEEVVIDFSKIDGEVIVISITNGHLTDEMSYSISETNEESNIELNTDNTSSDNDNRPNQVYKIFIDEKEYKIDNFSLNGRAFVDINEFCDKSKICNVSYTDDNYNKIKVTSTLSLKHNTYEYILINEKQQSVFDSTLSSKDFEFDLSQLEVDAKSCPEGKDSLGYDIPKCDSNSFYVPLRFVTQALGYNVEWNEKSRERIDISSGLQDKLIEENNIRTILSKNKVDIGNIVTNIIEINDKINLEPNEKYYAYSIDKENKRVFNSGFSLLNGNKEKFNIINDLDTNKNKNTTYSILETGNSGSAMIAVITTITVPGDSTLKGKSGIYPIIKEFEVKIGE